jgi:hypothetical protein
MRSLTADHDLYVVKPTHINTDLEQVVETHAQFVVVRKPAPS